MIREQDGARAESLTGAGLLVQSWLVAATLPHLVRVAREPRYVPMAPLPSPSPPAQAQSVLEAAGLLNVGQGAALTSLSQRAAAAAREAAAEAQASEGLGCDMGCDINAYAKVAFEPCLSRGGVGWAGKTLMAASAL
jgi:hypothetical protein